eukprot:2068396-Amphidinium_carterae.1
MEQRKRRKRQRWLLQLFQRLQLRERKRQRRWRKTERTKEKEARTTSCATTVENLGIQAANVGGNRKDNSTTSTNLNQC